MSDKSAATFHGETGAEVLKRATAQAERYEARIAQQKDIINRLQSKVLAYQEKYGDLDD